MDSQEYLKNAWILISINAYQVDLNTNGSSKHFYFAFVNIEM